MTGSLIMIVDSSPLSDDVWCLAVDTFQVFVFDVFWTKVSAKSSVVCVDDVNDFVMTVDWQLVVLTSVRQQSFTAFHSQTFTVVWPTELKLQKYRGNGHLIISNLTVALLRGISSARGIICPLTIYFLTPNSTALNFRHSLSKHIAPTIHVLRLKTSNSTPHPFERFSQQWALRS